MTTTSAETSTASTPAVNTFKDLEAVLANSGAAHLGDMVWWRLAGAAVSRTVMEAAFQANGIDTKFLPEQQTPAKALNWAVRNAGTGTQNKLGVLLRPLESVKGTTVFAVIHEGEANNQWSGNEVARIMLDHVSGAISTNNPADETAQAVIKEFNQFLYTHPAKDLMASMIKVLKSFKSVTLRDGGGVYWVPRNAAEGVRALKKAVETIGKSHVTVLPVNDTAEGRVELADAAAGSIEAELADMQKEIAKFVAGETNPHVDTLEARLEAYQELKGKAALYQSILSVTVADLDAQLEAMAEVVTGMLAQKV